MTWLRRRPLVCSSWHSVFGSLLSPVLAVTGEQHPRSPGGFAGAAPACAQHPWLSFTPCELRALLLRRFEGTDAFAISGRKTVRGL